MNDQHTQWEEKLAKIEQAIAVQEGLRGTLEEAQIEAALEPLREKRRVLLTQLEGSGGVAQGPVTT